MAAATPPSRSVWRVVAVALIAFVGLANTLPDISLAWHPFSDFGMQLDAAATVIGVDAGKSAARAGVRPGDRIDLTATPLSSRQYITTGFAAAPEGKHAVFAFARPGGALRADLIAEPRQRSLLDNLTNALLMLTFASMIAIAASLVLLRPSKMTWAFFLFAAFTGVQSTVSLAYLPMWAFVGDTLIWSVSAASTVPFAIFALRFPNDEAIGWRRHAQSVILWSLVVLVPLGIWNAFGLQLALRVVETQLIGGIVSIAGLIFVAVVFALTYAHAPAVDRAKIRWVMLGLLIGETGGLIWQVGGTLPGIAVPWSIPVLNLVLSMQIAVPITVAYAIVRHRVFDVRFVLGRAVVYGLITTAVVVFVALIDFVAGKVLAETHLAAVGEVGAAIVLGLSLNSMHKRAEHTVDTMLFRSRRRAERRLVRVGNGLLHAESPDAVTQAIVSEPLEAFTLLSSGVLRRNGDGNFVRVAAIGWDDVSEDTLDAHMPVVLQLSAANTPLAVTDGLWPPGLLPSGSRRPAYALPVSIRGRLDTIAFFGAHASGEDLDPDELQILTHLLASAGFAYDHLEAEAAIARSSALEAENRTLRNLITQR